MGDGSRVERITMVSLLQRGMSMSGTNHVIRVHHKGCLSIGRQTLPVLLTRGGLQGTNVTVTYAAYHTIQLVRGYPQVI